MKSNRFLLLFLGSTVLLVLGYFGFVSMPDKTSGFLIPVVLLCLLMLLAGAVGMIGALVYAVVKATGNRKPPGAEGNQQ
jgi:ammonia channel protein AmtB